MLYLPRGWVHQAYSEDAPTLHVSVRVETFRWLEIGVEALRPSADRNEDLRKSLPYRFLDNPETSQMAAQMLHDFMGTLMESCDHPAL
jgi:ribosomal protein L16 Arg81 hydroxylase